MSCTEPQISKVLMNLSNSQGTCRVCMKNNNSMKELFGSDCKIVDRIQFCTGIILRENHTLPSCICAECLSHLSIAYNFKTTCIASDKIYKIVDVKVEVKTEVFDNSTVKMEIEDLYKVEVEVDDSKETVELLIDKRPDSTRNIVKLPRPTTEEIVGQSLNSNTNTVKLKVVCKEEKPTKKEQNKTTKKEKKQRKYLTFRKLFCLRCNIRFNTKEESIEHHSVFHSTHKYICEICGKQFIYQAAYNAHKRIHVGPSYSCAHCTYATVNKSDLIKHIRLHTGEKTFHCHACPGAFRTSSSLHTHVRHKHGGQKKYPCDRCDKCFFSGNELKRHLDSHKKIKRYECPVCHSCFVLRSGWKRHLLSQHAVTVPAAKPGPKKTNLDKELNITL